MSSSLGYNLRTNPGQLTVGERRQLINFLRIWCSRFFVTKKHKHTLSVICVTTYDRHYPIDLHDIEWDGRYDPHHNRIYLNLVRIRTVKRLIQVFIHEWIHSTQPVRKYYKKYLEIFDYVYHPQEVHARAFEIYYKHAWSIFLQYTKMKAKQKRGTKTRNIQ